MIGENEEYDEEEVDRDTKSLVRTAIILGGLIFVGFIALIWWLW